MNVILEKLFILSKHPAVFSLYLCFYLFAHRKELWESWSPAPNTGHGAGKLIKTLGLVLREALFAFVFTVAKSLVLWKFVALLGSLQFGFLDYFWSPTNLMFVLGTFALYDILPGQSEKHNQLLMKHGAGDIIKFGWVGRMLSFWLGYNILEVVTAVIFQLTMPKTVMWHCFFAMLCNPADLYSKLKGEKSLVDTLKKLEFHQLLLVVINLVFPFIAFGAVYGVVHPALASHAIVKYASRMYYPLAVTAIISSALHSYFYHNNQSNPKRPDSVGKMFEQGSQAISAWYAL